MPDKLPLSVQFSTAGLGGIFGWIIVHPFNTVFVQMNLNKASAQSHSKVDFRTFAMKMINERGVLSLYNGLGAGITRQIFYATSRFGFFEIIRDSIEKYRKTDIISRLFAGCISGGIGAMISCPAEVTLVRMSNDSSLPIQEQRKYTGVFNAAYRIYRDEGSKAFFNGVTPFVQRAMLVGAVQVGTYDQFRASYKSLGLQGFTNTFAASMSSGLLYSLITMPLETAKNILATQMKNQITGTYKYTGTIQTITLLSRERGILHLWTGFLPYYIRCGGHTVCMFVFVEAIRDLYIRLKK